MTLANTPPEREEHFDSKPGSESIYHCPLGVMVQNYHEKYYLGVSMLSNVQFWLKNGHFDPFQTLLLRRKKTLTFHTWRKKSLVLPSWGQAAKLA